MMPLADIEFAAPWVFLFAGLPILIYWLLPKATPAASALRIPFYADVTDSYRQPGKGPGRLLVLWLGLIWCLLVLAGARPQILGQQAGTPISGRDLMMAVDVSGSMKKRDMFHVNPPEDRLSTVKRVAGEFIAQRQGDRIGLILFGSRAYLQAPLSLDRITVNQLLQEAVVGIAGERTAIGDAIGLAIKRLESRPGSDKVLILLTDGENTSGAMGPLKAAELARLAGMRIHTIGVGSQLGGSSGIFGGVRFRQTLEEIARITGGQSFQARDREDLSRIYALINELEPVDDPELNLRPKTEFYPLPLALALLGSILLALIRVFPVSWPWHFRAANSQRPDPGRLS